MNTWYRIRNAADGRPVQVSIHDEIGAFGISARDFIAAVNAIPADTDIDLSIHSPGGDVFDGLAIYHVLARRRDRLTARIEGLAASAASLIAMAAGRIEMPANAFMMIHNPWTFAIGDAENLRDTAEVLDKIGGSLVDIYTARSGQAAEQVREWLAAETWMDGREAVERGFADVLLPALAVAAKLSPEAAKRFGHAPQALCPTEPVVAAPMAADAVADRCVAAGFPALAAALIRDRADADTVRARLDAATEIQALAQVAGRPEQAERMILDGLAVEEARTRLLAMRRADDPPVQGAQTPAGGYEAPAEPAASTAATAKRLDHNAIYAARQAANFRTA